MCTLGMLNIRWPILANPPRPSDRKLGLTHCPHVDGKAGESNPLKLRWAMSRVHASPRNVVIVLIRMEASR